MWGVVTAVSKATLSPTGWASGPRTGENGGMLRGGRSGWSGWCLSGLLEGQNRGWKNKRRVGLACCPQAAGSVDFKQDGENKNSACKVKENMTLLVFNLCMWDALQYVCLFAPHANPPDLFEGNVIILDISEPRCLSLSWRRNPFFCVPALSLFSPEALFPL